MKKKEINKGQMLKFISTTIIISLIFTYFIKLFFQINLSFFRFFLVIIGIIGLFLCSLFFDKEDLKWIVSIIVGITGILITISTFIMPILVDDNISEQSLESYISNNVKCAIYFKYQGSEWSDVGEWYIPTYIGNKYEIVIYILNMGTKNLDKDLSIQIVTSDINIILKKPTEEDMVSNQMDSFIPWIFGNNLSVSIIWNESTPDTTLEKKDSKWAIVDFLYHGYLYFDDFSRKINVTVKIDDLYDVKITEIPSYIGIPSGHPNDWSIEEVLNDIEQNIIRPP